MVLLRYENLKNFYITSGMQKRLLFDSRLLQFTISRLCQQLIENHKNFTDTVLIGLQPRGIFLAERIRKNLEALLGKKVLLGYLDTTFHRDDFRRRDSPITPHETRVNFVIENKKVILIDDVLFTGRSVRAALDAMVTYGRPSKVELLTLIDRMYSRDIPVEATYVGRRVNTVRSQRILVELQEQGMPEDNIWIMEKEEVV